MRIKLSVPVWAIALCVACSLFTFFMLVILTIYVEDTSTDHGIWENLSYIWQFMPFLLPQVFVSLLLHIFLNSSKLSVPRLLLSLGALIPYGCVAMELHYIVTNGIEIGAGAVLYLAYFILACGVPTYFVARYLKNVVKAKLHAPLKTDDMPSSNAQSNVI